MGNGYLWIVNSDGVPYRVTADSRIEHVSDVQWKPEPVVISGRRIKVCHLVASPHAVFALDETGAVFQFVLTSVLTIRQQVEIFSNQRWYPLLGWSSRTLPTDQTLTSESQWKSENMHEFQLKSEGWRWEEPWIIDLDARKCDKEGWQYASNFTAAVWTPNKCVNSFVRRRKWKRYMRYTSVEKWAKLPCEDIAFVELAIGGFDCSTEQQYTLFALSTGGNVYRSYLRVVVSEDREELIKISCSAALGTLIVMTWDGRLFLRSGITQDTPIGICWCSLQTPLNQPVAFVSIGTKSLWTVSANAKMWMKCLKHGSSSETSFLSTHYSAVSEEVYGIGVNSTDQVVGISAIGDAVYVRDGISVEEPAGRIFLRLVERTSQKAQKWCMVTNSGAIYTSIPRHWINEHILVVNTSHYRNTSWRKQILHDICTMNEACWEVFKTCIQDFSALISVKSDYDYSASIFTICATFYSSIGCDLFELGFSGEYERDEWYELLSMVSLSVLDKSPSFSIPGCMKSVSAGANGIVWSLSHDGVVYTLSPDYDLFSGNVFNFSLVQKTIVIREVMLSLVNVLESRQWRWIDSNWKVVDIDNGDGWTYSDDIDGIYYKEKRKKDSARRRIWQRRAQFQCRGPWLAVEAPPIRCIEVQKAESDRILVWAVTVRGEILLRQGVTAAHPQGTIWKHIICNNNIASISIGSPTCVWATTSEGRLLRRECSDQTDIECVGKHSTCST
ncbi:Propeller [Dictyocaulus viviparus]|uniref:Propeller n=1 Tax=Dictyocaulus viviparus TaxID=29172 RepID=A0A0D8XPC7_DICVI|nr:Propeller [Dictyocaulus viviparus]